LLNLPYLPRTLEPELLDSPAGEAFTPVELAENMADIARLNRLMRTTHLLCGAAFELLPPKTKTCVALDLGTGAGDWPPAFIRFSANQSSPVEADVIAADLQPAVLRYARRQLPVFRLLGADGTRLPLRSNSVDVIVCAQTFHHLTPVQAVDLLREMVRVSRYGFVLFDLTRSQSGFHAVQLLTSLISRNRLTRHDGPLSVRRAYQPKEVYALAVRAGLNTPAFQIRVVWPFRWLAIYRARL
jgi:ubiquinone/menaquinone biosynthesis C-methylase UbiE